MATCVYDLRGTVEALARALPRVLVAERGADSLYHSLASSVPLA